MTPTKVAFCITELDPGGAERALFNIVTRLDREMWTPQVFCLGPEAELVAPLRRHGIEVACYGGTPRDLLGAIKWLKRELHRFQPALLQCFLFHANIVGRLAGHSLKIPVLAGHRVAEREKQWHLWLDWLTKKYVAHHVAVSEQVRTHVLQRLKLAFEQCTVIPNGVDAALMNVAPLSDSDLWKLNVNPSSQRMLLAAGRLHPQKGFLDLLQAFHQIHERLPDVQLVILGEGPQWQVLDAEIERLGLAQRVTLAGYRSDLTAIMQRADLFVLSSHWEGMSNALLEAMATGCPIVTTDVEGVRDVVQHQKSAWITPPGDTYALGNGVVEVLGNPQLAAELGRKAQVIATEELSWNEVAKNYGALFLNVLSRSSGNRQKGGNALQ